MIQLTCSAHKGQICTNSTFMVAWKLEVTHMDTEGSQWRDESSKLDYVGGCTTQ